MEEISLKKGILQYKRKLKRGETYRVDRRRKYTSIHIIKKAKIVTGVSSRTEDGFEVLFMDYDKVDLSLVKSDYKIIQEAFGLSQGYLFTTGMQEKDGEIYGNFHVISLTKKSPFDIISILKHSHVDVNYIDSPIRNRQRCWILRIGEKGKRPRPEFLELIGDKTFNDSNVISTSHKKFLSKLYPKIKHPIYKKEDNFSKFYLQDYETL